MELRMVLPPPQCCSWTFGSSICFAVWGCRGWTGGTVLSRLSCGMTPHHTVQVRMMSWAEAPICAKVSLTPWQGHVYQRSVSVSCPYGCRLMLFGNSPVQPTASSPYRLPVSCVSLCKTVWPLLGEAQGLSLRASRWQLVLSSAVFISVHFAEKKSLSVKHTDTFQEKKQKTVLFKLFQYSLHWGIWMSTSQVHHAPNSTLMNAFIAIAERLRTAALFHS